jgi:glycosyltransferase involved in cell wall biosynthesis
LTDKADVAVVIPCYGYAHLLPEALDSVLEQTCVPRRVMVVDDGSPDDTAGVAERYGEAGVEYLWRPNGGPGAARNSGAAACDTEYLVFLDADDRLDPRYLEHTVPMLDGAGDEIGYVYTQCRYFGDEDGTTAFPPWDAAKLLRWPFVHASALVRSELLARFPYDERRSRGLEDWDFYLTLAEHGIAGILVDEPLLLYRKHGAGSRGGQLEVDPTAERTFRHVLRKHWRLGGLAHALRVEAYYARRSLERRLGSVTSRPRRSTPVEPADQ